VSKRGQRLIDHPLSINVTFYRALVRRGHRGDQSL